MKVLFLSHGRTCEDQIGYREALLKAHTKGERIELNEIPFEGFVEKHGWDGFYSEVLRVNDEWRPDLVFFQFFHGGKIESPAECISRLKSGRNRPFVIGSQGDLFDVRPFGVWRRRPETALVDLAIGADVFFTTSMGAFADFMVRKGARRIIFLPHAFSPPHFSEFDFNAPADKSYDVTMVGSIGFSRRRPIGTLLNSFKRKRTADSLWRCYRNRFALYGNGWGKHPASHGAIPFREQVRAFRLARCAVDAPPPSPEVYYASDRPFFIAGCGVPLVQYHTPRFENVLREGEHVFFVRHGDSVCTVCRRLLSRPQEELDELGRRTREFVFSRHTVDRRIDTMLSVVERLRDGQTPLRLWHFLPETDCKTELRFAGRNIDIC